MDSSEFENNVCRICLDENVAFNWNNTLIEYGDVTYKDCYYKYTQLKQLDDDPLPSMLCKNCSNSLEDVHLLIQKALDSYSFLLEVNCAKMDIEDSNIVEDETNCSSTDFETVLVEKLDPESKMLEQYEYESLDEFSIKSEDNELEKIEDNMQYQEIQEVEDEQEEFDSNQCIEDNDVVDNTSTAYESAKIKSKRVNSCIRKCRKDENSEKKIVFQKPIPSCTPHSGRMQSMKRKYNNFDEISIKSEDGELHNLINSEESQNEEIFYSEDQEDYETSLAYEVKHTDEEFSSVYKGTRKKFTNKLSLKEDVKSIQEYNLNKSTLFNSHHKKHSQRQLLPLKNDSKTKNRRIKTKKEIHQNSQNTPSMCSYCSKILHNKYALQKHEKTHLARERNAPCPICGVKFLEESYVKTHMQIHNQNRIKKHKCEFCDKAFYEKGSLNVHRRIHLGQMIPCSLCSKEFFRQVDLDIHMNSHSAVVINAEMKKRSRYWVRCKYCNKDIMSTSFKYHTAVHLNEPQMKCSICEREFFRRDSCTEHLKTIHKKTTEEYSNFIILYNKNRLSHLYLEQTTELKK